VVAGRERVAARMLDSVFCYALLDESVSGLMSVSFVFCAACPVSRWNGWRFRRWMGKDLPWWAGRCLCKFLEQVFPVANSTVQQGNCEAKCQSRKSCIVMSSQVNQMSMNSRSNNQRTILLCNFQLARPTGPQSWRWRARAWLENQIVGRLSDMPTLPIRER